MTGEMMVEVVKRADQMVDVYHGDVSLFLVYQKDIVREGGTVVRG